MALWPLNMIWLVYAMQDSWHTACCVAYGHVLYVAVGEFPNIAGGPDRLWDSHDRPAGLAGRGEETVLVVNDS